MTIVIMVFVEKMGCTKSIVAQTSKGKRVRVDCNSPEPSTRNFFRDSEKKK